MRNHIYEVMWNYEDEQGWRDMCQYIVVFDNDSELGKIIDKAQFEGDEEWLGKLDEALLVAFGIKDNEVAFYLGETKEPTQEEMIKTVKADGDIVVKEVLGKYYENEDFSEKYNANRKEK